MNNGRKGEVGNGENSTPGIIASGRKPSTMSRMELALAGVEEPLQRMQVKNTLSRLRQANALAAEKALLALETRGFEFFQDKYLGAAGEALIKEISASVPRRVSLMMTTAQASAANGAGNFAKATEDLKAVFGEVTGNQSDTEGSEK